MSEYFSRSAGVWTESHFAISIVSADIPSSRGSGFGPFATAARLRCRMNVMLIRDRHSAARRESASPPSRKSRRNVNIDSESASRTTARRAFE